MIRILLAEDQTLVRDGLCALLAIRDGFEVVAVANGKEAVTAAREERFDIAVIDVRMPVMDGIECTRLLKEEHPGMPVLILTTFDDHSLVQKCLEAGASAYLLKDIHPDDLVNAIRLLLAGERLIPGDLARTLSETDDIPAEPLTPRRPRGAFAHRPRPHQQRDRQAALPFGRDRQKHCQRDLRPPQCPRPGAGCFEILGRDIT